MKINWKKIGSKLLVVINGKVETSNGEQKNEELINLIKEVNEQQEKRSEEQEKRLIDLIDQKINEQKYLKQSIIKQKIVENEKIKSELVEKVVDIEIKKNKQEIIEKTWLTQGIPDDRFTILKSGEIQLVDYPYNIPRPLLLEFADKIYDNKSIDYLINFWVLLLLNPNEQSIKDSFKYLIKNGLTITKSGYFLTFRRVLKKESVEKFKKNEREVEVSEYVVKEFAEKVKKWKSSLKGYFICNTEENATTFILVRKDKLKSHHIILGSVDSFLNNKQVVKKEEKLIKTRDLYTDNYTKTFTIEIGTPVFMPREKCNEDQNEDCSYGLHVGTPQFVKDGSSFGSIMIACLVNPMHIVSVPYSNAHKMRVCEYLPIKVINSASEIDEFEKSDLLEFDYAYLQHENAEMNEKLKSLKSLKKIFNKDSFSDFIKYKDVQQLDELQKKIEDLKQQNVELKINNDPINSALDLDAIQKIVESRLVKVK